MISVIFHDNCPHPRVSLGDFAKGLGASAAQAETERLQRIEDGITQEGEEEGVVLQLCEWHAAEAIKKRLIRAGYSKEKEPWNELCGILWDWIKSPTMEVLDQRRERLLTELNQEEQLYISNFYLPKEPQFIRTYTRQYANLGLHSTSRSEGYHPTIKKVCSRQGSMAQAVYSIRNLAQQLDKKHDQELNKERLSLPRLLDKKAFAEIGPRVTHFALNLLSREWEETKLWADKVTAREVSEPRDLDSDNMRVCGCPRKCDLLTQYGLPC